MPEVADYCHVRRVTVWGWVKDGVGTPAGRVRLAAVRVGRNFLVTRAALAEFIRACNPDPPVVPESQAAQETRLAADRRALLDMLGDGHDARRAAN